MNVINNYPLTHLVTFRNALGLNQAQFANQLGFAKSTYEKIERGERNPSYNFIRTFVIKFPQADIKQLFFYNATHKMCALV